MMEKHGQRCLSIKCDIRFKEHCESAVQETISQFCKLNNLVDNAAYQQPFQRFEEITEEALRRTFEINIFGYFFMTQAALSHMREGDTIGFWQLYHDPFRL